ncbi:transposase [Streptomyces sp. NPDC056352]|uniref:transposase n=1 Tax=Streptomyces sp. NPDC056352 TaxID=3345791 RepID=UPI0035D82713
MDLDGPGERSPCGYEALPGRVQGRRGRVVPVEAGATIRLVAADLGVNTETLRNWIRAAAGRRSSAHSAPPAATQSGTDAVQAELVAARKRIRELEEERDILRKAARPWRRRPRSGGAKPWHPYAPRISASPRTWPR